MARPEILLWVSCVAAVLAASPPAAVSAVVDDSVGVNWGTMSSHPMLPGIVVQMLKDNGIKKVKMFDADPWTVGALAGSGIEVMLAIPNDQLEYMSGEYDHAKEWVKENVSRWDYDGGVDIKYVAVGNEPFLTSYNGSFMGTTFPALKNIQRALDEAGYGDRIKATVPFNADVYSSPDSNPVPSTGSFRSDIRGLMTDIVKFLDSNGAPFVVNIYPYLSLYQNPGFPVDYAFFDGTSRPLDDGGRQYTNVFDANFDTLVWSLQKAGVPDMRIVVGEVGWPTDGDRRANATAAQRFYDGFFRKMATEPGTPMRPGRFEAYLFGLFDEDMKSVQPGNFERHWGIFRYDGTPKFKVDFAGKGGGDEYPAGARGVQYLPRQWCVFDDGAEKASYQYGPESVNYACSNADCTPLGLGSSCYGELSRKGNMSYAFNAYFQTMDQDVRACTFKGLAKLTDADPSTGRCLFPVQILNGVARETASLVLVLLLAAAAAVSLTFD